MLQLSQVSLDVVLLVARAMFLLFGLVLAAFAFTRWRRASERSEELLFQQNGTLLARLNSLEEELRSLRAQQSGACDQLATLASLAEQLRDSEQRRTSGPVPASAPSYQIAIRLARSGAPREELMASCGLSRQEAELVQRLHAPSRTAKLAAAG